MTHSLHRQGSEESLKGEFVVLSVGDTYFLAPLRKYLRRKFPVAYGMLQEAAIRVGVDKILRVIKQGQTKKELRTAVVLNSKEELCDYLEKAKQANTGKSIVVSGIFYEVNDCLRSLKLCPHTVQYSLGYFGRTELLPKPGILELTSMCGHHMISPKLVEKLAGDVGKGAKTAEDAAQAMTKLCSCQIFNTARATKLIKDLSK